ncbi:hypothetical protein BO85DRAFT_448011 [Aspergillus piperis CBS 112811]|uniref:Uncharacterized protein n=1 Tax=Aspergillus piperis CBS 112811 TaxID=1448313 RepID=A0A8G1R3X7_9EURO|nr:hypothetical protein BO85DRAFT_448011 [Aspergillus piperis CBS 112811]RAH59019.1 hypothetical protein BO85DRAFT_448011 [Aspergillus piperis CBS 112811]
MSANKKTTIPTPPSSSSQTSSQIATIPQRIVRNRWTLPSIVLFTASIRWLWGYMQWPNGGDLALSLNTGFLILYVIIWRYVDG